MRILYLANSSNWHIDLWTQYFTKAHSVFLFSEKENYLNDQPFKGVVITHSEGVLGRVFNYLNITSHRLFQLNKLLSARFYAAKIDQLVLKQKIDVIHAHTLFHGYITSYLKSSVPVIFTPMGSDIIIHAQQNLIYKVMAHKAFKKATVTTGDSIILQQQGYKVGAKAQNNHIIQNGVDSSIFKPRTAKKLKQDLGVLKDETLIFSPRAITPLYNIDTIIDSLSELKKTNPRFKCMFSYAFGGEYYIKLKEKVISLGLSENVIWLGYINYEDMQLYYNAADLVISVPSSDSSPKSVYEAMFCGKPVIISDLAWSHELLDELDCVLRVEVKKPVQLAQAIKSLIDDNELLKTLSKNSLLMAHKFFDYDMNMKKMEAIMLSTLVRSKDI